MVFYAISLTLFNASVSISRMLSIRLQRVGRKHEPVFRVVLTDSKNGPKSGKVHEVLGSYDSRRGDKSVVDADRVKYWMSKGAKLSDTMHNLLVDKKIISGKKVNVLPRKSPIKKEGAEPAPASAAPAPAPEAPQA
jgi:small subunit ribosomal protein S16